MFRFAATQLSVGLSVIVDCPMARKELFLRAKEIAEQVTSGVCGDDKPFSPWQVTLCSERQHNARPVLLECVPGDEGVWRRRLEERGASLQATAQSHKPTTWAELQQLIERCIPPPLRFLASPLGRR